MDKEPMVITGNKKKALLLLAASAAFIAIGISTVHDGDGRGWLAIGFFSLCGLCAVYMLLPNTVRMTIDEHGVEMKSPFRPMKLSWKDVDSFYVGRIKTGYSSTELIGIKFSSSYNKTPTGRQIASALTGMEGALPNHFNKSAEELCAVLNEWKQRDSILAQPLQPIARTERAPAAMAALDDTGIEDSDVAV